LHWTGHWKIIDDQDKTSAEKKRLAGKRHKGWQEKCPLVKAIYRNYDPAYPQKRQFDLLYALLFHVKDRIMKRNEPV
jgi:hypothetical protein